MSTIKQINSVLSSKGYKVKLERCKYTNKVNAYFNPFNEAGEMNFDYSSDDHYCLESIRAELSECQRLSLLKYNAYCH